MTKRVRRKKAVKQLVGEPAIGAVMGPSFPRPNMEYCAVFINNEAEQEMNKRFADGWAPRDYGTAYGVGMLVILEREKRG